jgi:hypothetical protein
LQAEELWGRKLPAILKNPGKTLHLTEAEKLAEVFVQEIQKGIRQNRSVFYQEQRGFRNDYLSLLRESVEPTEFSTYLQTRLQRNLELFPEQAIPETAFLELIAQFEAALKA